MNDSRTEYLGATNGNGNGNGHEKIFGLTKTDDPILAKVAPAARKECCRDNGLTEGARMFFCYLVDCSLTFGVYIRKGMVKFSDRDLGSVFNVNSRTIRNWKNALAQSGRIWITERWNKNSFPTTVYNITAIIGQPELPLESESRDGSLVQNETFANSNRHPGRFLKRNPENGKWVGRGGFEARPPERPKNQETGANKRADEKILPPSEETNFPPQGKEIAVLNGKNLPTPSAEFCRSGGKEIAVGDGKILPLPKEKFCRGEGNPIADNGKTGDVSLSVSEVPFKRSTGLIASNGSGGAKKLNAENLFLLDVGAMMESWKKGSSKGELSGSGAWWRMSYRNQPDLMRRILAEVSAMIKESKIKFNPGSTAVDLFKRWGGVQGQRKQKATAGTALKP